MPTTDNPTVIIPNAGTLIDAGVMLDATNERFFTGTVPNGTPGEVVGIYPTLADWFVVRFAATYVELAADDDELAAKLDRQGYAEAGLALRHLEQKRQTCSACTITVGTKPDPSTPWRPYRTEVLEADALGPRRLFHYCADPVACQERRARRGA